MAKAIKRNKVKMEIANVIPSRFPKQPLLTPKLSMKFEIFIQSNIAELPSDVLKEFQGIADDVVKFAGKKIDGILTKLYAAVEAKVSEEAAGNEKASAEAKKLVDAANGDVKDEMDNIRPRIRKMFEAKIKGDAKRNPLLFKQSITTTGSMQCPGVTIARGAFTNKPPVTADTKAWKDLAQGFEALGKAINTRFGKDEVQWREEIDRVLGDVFKAAEVASDPPIDKRVAGDRKAVARIKAEAEAVAKDEAKDFISGCNDYLPHNKKFSAAIDKMIKSEIPTTKKQLKLDKDLQQRKEIEKSLKTIEIGLTAMKMSLTDAAKFVSELTKTLAKAPKFDQKKLEAPRKSFAAGSVEFTKHAKRLDGAIDKVSKANKAIQKA